jgi:hypothetical protein
VSPAELRQISCGHRAGVAACAPRIVVVIVTMLKTTSHRVDRRGTRTASARIESNALDR